MKQRFNLGGKAPRCPLCHAWMERMWEPVRRFFIFKCDVDRIAIRVDDPFVGRWEAAAGKTEPVLCPNPKCDARPMRVFATSTGFMKGKCVKCGTTISNAEPDRDRTKDIATPDKPGILQ